MGVGDASHLTPDLFAFVTAWLPPPPSRLVEIGCGDGELTRLLSAAGWDAIGVDPEAPDGERFVRATLEELDFDPAFDAAVAIRSLHHVADLDRGVERLDLALRPGGRLILFEFVVEHIDESTERWLEQRDLPLPVEDDHRSEIWRLADLRTGLERRFVSLHAEGVTYLAQEAGRAELEPEERDAIADGTLRPAGIRLVYAKRPRARR